MGKLGRIEIEIVEGDVKRSCTFHHSTVRKLLDHIDAINADNQRLIGNVTQLQKEQNEMKVELDRATSDANEWEKSYFNLRDNKAPEKVVLPRKIAELMDRYFTKDFNDESKGWGVFNIMHLDGKHLDIPAREIKYHFGIDHYKFISAVVNGYTVEEEPTTEERIKNKLYEELVFQRILSPIKISKLAQNLTLAIREILAEDAVKQHES